MKYKTLNPVICINILDFILFPEIKKIQIHRCCMLTDMENPDIILSDQLQMHFIELPQLEVNKTSVPENRLLKWIQYLREEGVVEEKDMNILSKHDKIFDKAHETFVKFTADEMMQDRYEAREKYRKDQASAMGHAKDRGIEKGIAKTAANMKKESIAPELIQKVTGLSLEEIDKI